MTIELDLALHSYSFVHNFQHRAGYSVFDFIDRAVDLGFTGVNINLNRPDWRHLTGRSPEHAMRVRRYLKERGLSLEIDTSGTDPDHLRPLLHLAKALGARNLRTYTRHHGTLAEVAAKTTADLKRAAVDAKNAGVELVLENHEEFSGPELARIIDAVSSPWLKVLYDYGNSQMVLEDPGACLDALLPHVRTLHLKDHLMLAAEDSPDGKLSVLGVAMGDGALPIVELSQRLIAGGQRRIVFESVWSYRAPVVRQAETPLAVKLGEGTFRFARPPFDGVKLLPDAAALAKSDPARLCQLEDEAVTRGLTWLKAAFAKAGWAIKSR